MASDAVVNLVVDATRTEGQIAVQLRRVVNAAENNAPPIVLNVQVDNRSVTNVTNQIINDMRTINQAAGDADDSSSRLSNTFRSMGSLAGSLAGIGLRLGAIGVAAGGAVPLVAGLVGALASIAPAAAAGVTAFVALKGATATLKLALTGVSEAISAVFDPDADPEALAEALERLAPEARSFVLELQRMRPAFEALRLDVQNRVFRNLDTEVRTLARQAFPELRTAARSFADTFNDMAVGAARSGQTLSKEGSLGQALGSGTEAFQNLERVPGQVLLAIGRLAAAGGPLLIRFSEAVASKFDDLSKRIAEGIESGALEDAVNGAGDALSQLGEIGSNLGEVLGNIFGAAAESGNGLFDALEKITQAMADATATTEFQDALGALSEVAATLVDTVLPILAEAFQALLPVIEQIAPPVQELITVLGESLMELMPELQPVLQELAGLFVSIVEAVIPLIPPLTQIISDILPLLQFFLRGTAEIIENVIGPALFYFVEGVALLVSALEDMAGETLREIVIPAMRAVAAVLRGDWSGAMDAGREAAIGMSNAVFGAFVTMNERGQVQLGSLSRAIVDKIRDSTNAASRRVVEFVVGLLRQLQQIPSGARAALGDMGNVLVQSGASLIRGFINGMLSQISGIRNAASRLVSAARDFFPGSPAKRGPFSGKGWTLYSGQATGEAFAKGLQDRRQTIQRTLEQLLQPGSPTLDFAGIAAGSGGQAISGLSPMGTFQRSVPSLNVFIGNQVVRDFVRVEVAENNQDRDRQASQGVRF